MADDREFATVRAHQDAKVAAGLARNAAWAATSINGGGALLAGMLSMPVAFAGYALGAFFGASMLFVLFQWIERWNLYWEAIARGQGQAAVNAVKARATRLTPSISICFALSMLGFAAAAIALVGGMMSLAAPPQ